MVDRSTEEPVELWFVAASPTGTRYVAERVWGATICPDCSGCRGCLHVEGRPLARYRQLCRCERDRRAEPEEKWKVEISGVPEDRWPGFDFNTYLEVCRCCGIEPLKSGSRWSLFFCKSCVDRVASFNRRHRRWIIPIGRHSMMHGDWLGGDEAAIEEHAEHFVAHVRGLFAAADHLDNWASACVRENLEVLGFSSGEEVELGRYLRAARARGLDKQAAFEKLLEHFAVTGGGDG